MNKLEFEDWCRQQQLATHTIDLIAQIRKSPPSRLTGVGFLQLRGVKAKEIVNRSRRKRTPPGKMNRKMVE